MGFPILVTFHPDVVLFERFGVFVPCETFVRAGIRREGAEHVQRVVVRDEDPVGGFHDAAILEPIHRRPWVAIDLAADGDVTVRGELGSVREFLTGRYRRWLRNYENLD